MADAEQIIGDDLRVLSAERCDEKEQESCAEQFGENLEWACKTCDKTPPGNLDLHPYTQKLLRMRSLRMAGYPIKANELTYEEWIDLARIEQCLATPQFLK